ncbi:MAG: RHS repeat-associated core domain-containing protein [bacterium]|nr:RHS repeat-associated core domain-containing protein [bacterium]
MGDRLTQNGVQYTLDLNTGLTQVLADGTNTYLYGLGRIAERTGGVNEFHLGDALGSVRQLTNNYGEVVLAKSYDPYGNNLQSLGTGETVYGFTGETTDANGLVYLRARYYSPLEGRFVSRDTFGGIYTDPFTFNRWGYAHNNPVTLTDPSGHCDILCILAILAALGIIASGCSVNNPVDVCESLPESLEPDALKKMPRTQAIASIKDNFGIQLPPPAIYKDILGTHHTTSYAFKYSPVSNGRAGFTPWFTNQFEGSWGSKWGDVIIFEDSFKKFSYNAYDIAAVMVHEAMHAWQQYTLSQLAQDTQSTFMQDLRNHSYYRWEWGVEHTSVLEHEASVYVLNHAPTPLCISPTRRGVEEKNRNRYSATEPWHGLTLPWQMSGYPLP